MYAQFGWAVALSADGNALAIGAVAESSSTTGVNSAPDNAALAAGAAYVFTRIGNLWSQQAYVKASNTELGDRFGSSVALSADASTLAVGAIWEDSSSPGVNSMPNEAAPQSGAVYLY